MNSFENQFSQTPSSEELQRLEAEQAYVPAPESTLSGRAEVEEDLFRLGQEAIARLDFHIDKAPQPENALSQTLRNLSSSNPYADRLLATLGYDSHTSPSPEPLSDREKKVEVSISMMLKEVGQKTIANLLKSDAVAAADRIRNLPDLMQKGAASELEGRYDPLGGYFQKITVNEDGEVVRHGQQDRERWAKAILWSAPGVGELPEVVISEEQQQDLLQGYISAAIATVTEQSDDLDRIAPLLAMLNGAKDESIAGIKNRFSDGLAYVRVQLTDEERLNAFDQSLESLGMIWDEDSRRYGAEF